VGRGMSRKKTDRLVAFALTVFLTVALVGSTGCSCGGGKSKTDDTNAEVALMTSDEACSAVHQYLDDRLDDTYRSELGSWMCTASYRGQNTWDVCGGPSLGCWILYERTEVVEPQFGTAETIARDHFK
jgi:hypothetical protein